MKRFTYFSNGKSVDCYFVKTGIENNIQAVYYGHYIPSHENKKATAMMTVEYFNYNIKVGRIIGISPIGLSA